MNIIQEIENFTEAQVNEVKTLAEKGFGLCEKCQITIENIQNKFEKRNFGKSHTVYETQLDETEEEDVDLSHFITISESSGMPLMDSENICPECYTKLQCSMDGFNETYSIFMNDPKDEYKYQESKIFSFVNLIPIKLAEHLNEKIKSAEGEMYIYFTHSKDMASTTNESFKRLYEGDEEGYIKAINRLNISLTEKEIMLIKGVREREERFIIRAKYPVNKLTVKYSNYHKKIEISADKREILEREFFDVYKKAFVDIEDLDKSIHFFKRNHDTNVFLSENRKNAGVSNNEDYEEVERTMSRVKKDVVSQIMQQHFPEKYAAEQKEFEKSKKERKKFEESIKRMLDSREKPKEEKIEKETEFKMLDTIVIKSGGFKGLKGCVTHVDSEKKEVSFIIFGEKDSENELTMCEDNIEKV